VLRVSKKNLTDPSRDQGSPDDHDHTLSRLWMPPGESSCFCHIRPVLLSVIVPSPLSVYEAGMPLCISPSEPAPKELVWPVEINPLGRHCSGTSIPTAFFKTNSESVAVTVPLASTSPHSCAVAKCGNAKANARAAYATYRLRKKVVALHLR
jgi:hypothetical protein